MIAKTRGFTLLELVVVLVLLSMLLAFVVPSFVQVVRRNAVYTAAHELRLLLKDARDLSIRTGLVHGVCPVVPAAVGNVCESVGGIATGVPAPAPEYGGAEVEYEMWQGPMRMDLYREDLGGTINVIRSVDLAVDQIMLPMQLSMDPTGMPQGVADRGIRFWPNGGSVEGAHPWFYDTPVSDIANPMVIRLRSAGLLGVPCVADLFADMSGLFSVGEPGYQMLTDVDDIGRGGAGLC